MITYTFNYPIEYDKDNILNFVENNLGITLQNDDDCKIIRYGVAGIKESLHYRITALINVEDKIAYKLCKKNSACKTYITSQYKISKYFGRTRPLIIGSGPAGLFAALTLSIAGACPIVIERGSKMSERQKSVEAFKKSGVLNADSNIQFGEGGAGTFSDGKLKSGLLDDKKIFILEQFVSCGAPNDIIYRTDAHVGTDLLPDIITNIRKKIISLGGDFLWNTKMTDIITDGGRISGIVTTGGDYYSHDVILATGHSARDTFEMLYNRGLKMDAKNFGIGARVEHPREYINNLIYGKYYPDFISESASYHLVSHLKNGRSVYSFCMCPGGEVVSAASEHGGIVTNGMSPKDRNYDNSNAAILVSVSKDDFDTSSPLGGIYLQREIEKRAYDISSSYRAPVISLADFLNNNNKTRNTVIPSYFAGTIKCDMSKIFPDYITESLRDGINDFDRYLPGYIYDGAVMTAPETRSTSPVKILRDDTCQCVNLKGLYPCGEGGGYAGGIISSAYDGITCAEMVIKKYCVSN